MLSKKSETKLKANKLKFEAIGTIWEIDFESKSNDSILIESIIKSTIAEFDKHYSRFRPDSWVSKIGQHPGNYQVPSDFSKLHRFYESMAKITNEKVTVLIGSVMEEAGYDSNYSLVAKDLVRPKALNKVLEYKGNTLQVKYNCVLDYGAAGKGYLVDIIAEKINKYTTSFTIDAGGDIKYSPADYSLLTSVGLEDPNDPTKAIGIVNLGPGSICASAGNRRKWDKYHHIINPVTLESVSNISATWVIADNTMLADGMATCLFFENPSKLLNHYDFEYLILKCDNSISMSDNFNAEIFYKQAHE